MARDSNELLITEFKEELGANYLHALLGFSALLEEQLDRESSSSKGFMLLTQEALIHFDISKKDFTEEFGVHSSTVGRWAAGKTYPNKLVRPIILKWILECIEAEIRSYQSTYSAISKVDQKVKIKLDALGDMVESVAAV